MELENSECGGKNQNFVGPPEQGVRVSCEARLSGSCYFAAAGASAEMPVTLESESDLPLSSSSETAPSTTRTEFTMPLIGLPRSSWPVTILPIRLPDELTLF